MMKQKLLSGLLCATLAVSVTVPALADDAAVSTAEDAAVEATEVTAETPVGMSATVLSVQTDSETQAVTSVTVRTAVYDELVLLVSDGTVCIDTQTGDAAGLSALAEGDEIYAYISQTMTLSLPPQTAALAIVVDLGAEKAPAHLLTAEAVTRHDDGSVTVLCDGGSLLVTIPADASVTPYRTKNIVTLADLTVGTQFFAWYDVIAESYPGQTSTQQMVLLASDTEDTADAADLGEDRTVSIVVEGDMVVGQARVENGAVLVPLRALAECLGCTVTWSDTEKSASVVCEDHILVVDTLSGAVTLDGATLTLPAAAVLEDPGTLWVSLEAIEQLTGVTGELLDTALYV